MDPTLPGAVQANHILKGMLKHRAGFTGKPGKQYKVWQKSLLLRCLNKSLAYPEINILGLLDYSTDVSYQEEDIKNVSKYKEKH